MVTIENYLSKLSVGTLVKDARTLAALKKQGFINDYDKWGNLVAYNLYLVDDNGFKTSLVEYFGSKPQEGEKGSESEPLMKGDVRPKPVFTYKGCKFTFTYPKGSGNACLMYLGQSMAGNVRMAV